MFDQDDTYRREVCGACGSKWLEPVLNLGRSPLADAYTPEPASPPTWPLVLIRCTECTLVQLEHVLPAGQLFGTGYSFYSSASPPLSKYHEAYAADILSRHPLDRRRQVVEIGSNDGDLARHLIKAGFGVIGVDPAAGPAYAAADRGVTIALEPFTQASAVKIRDDYGPAELVIANHVLAHVADVSDMLAGISLLLDDGGVAYVEVQYLPDLLLHNAIDLVYHEHRNFFSLHSLAAAAAIHGLHVNTVEFTARQAGSIRVAMSHRPGAPGMVARALEAEAWLAKPGALTGLQGRAERLRERLRDILNTMPDAAVVAGYGAPAKATTLLHWCGLDSRDLQFVTDTTIAKQGLYIPGTGIQILPPHAVEDVDVYLLLAWNYMAEILRAETGFPGRWLIPVPAPILI
jgi:C-methyltransferase C-terminal domain/Methyltransferase domain/Putative zinc binding domain